MESSATLENESGFSSVPKAGAAAQLGGADRPRTPLLSLAPMEGLTGHTFRRIHAECFGALDRY